MDIGHRPKLGKDTDTDSFVNVVFFRYFAEAKEPLHDYFT